MSNEIKTHLKKLHNPDYLGAYAFQPNEKKTLTISIVRNELVTGPDGKKEECTVCHFKENGVKPLILNVTNSKTISKIHGTPYIEDWVGKRIELFVAQVKAFGEVVDAVRVSPVAPSEKQKPVFAPNTEAWGNALKKKATLEVIKKHYQISTEHEQQYNNELIGVGATA
jgi:hypothetical protein